MGGPAGASCLQLRARVSVCVGHRCVGAVGFGRWGWTRDVIDDENHSNAKRGGDTGNEMWNQGLLGKGRVKEQWW